MPKETLNGYWVKKDDPSVTIYVERVFKKGYVTGFKYTDEMGSTVIGQLKISHEELLEQYERK